MNKYPTHFGLYMTTIAIFEWKMTHMILRSYMRILSIRPYKTTTHRSARMQEELLLLE